MDILATVWKKTDSIVARKISDEVILVPIRHNVADLDSIYTLNETSARIWELIDGSKTGNEILTVITSEFEITSKQATDDLINFLLQLENIQAIKPVS